MNEKGNVQEKILKPMNGMVILILCILGLLASIGGIMRIAFAFEAKEISEGFFASILIVCILAFCLISLLLAGLKVINPNEALVLTLFGKYYGTLVQAGFFWVNPFCMGMNPAMNASVRTGRVSAANTLSRKISLKTMTLNNEKQKVNDELGNPIEIGAVVIWKVVNPTKAVINVENYKNYLSIQCDSIIRNTARCYPYDTSEGGDEKSLRGSSQEIAGIMSKELQIKVENAGMEIIEVRITHLAYAPEIASAMLQRQQAAAIIDARQKIVEGAVSMVDMALNKLSENDIVELDEERKAAMVSNLLVVLCGNKEAQPIVNSGSIY